MESRGVSIVLHGLGPKPSRKAGGLSRIETRNAHPGRLAQGSKEIMDSKEYLEYIAREIHTTVVATTDEEGLPVTCAIDIMDADGGGLYFLTAKGKRFYHRLKRQGYLALTGVKGKDTLSCVAVSVRGKVRELGGGMLGRLFEKNPYMNEIYPTQVSRDALTVFQIYQGTGEWFDLSVKPIERASFAFGGAMEEEQGFFVGQGCVGCGRCYSVCPQKCIDVRGERAVIQQSHCLHCGRCAEICPQQAIVKR